MCRTGMKFTRRWKRFGALLLAGVILGAIAVWCIGSIRPGDALANRAVGSPAARFAR